MYATRARIPDAALEDTASQPVEIVAALCESLAAERDLAATVNAVLESMVRLLHIQAAEAFFWNETTEDLTFGTSRGRSVVGHPDPRANDPLLDRCLSNGTLLLGHNDVTPCAYLPIQVNGGPYGVIRLKWDQTGTEFSPQEQSQLKALAQVTSMAVTNASLRATIEDHRDTTRDLEYAAEIQRNLLPSVTPGGHPVFGLNRPIRQVSGDFFDFFTLPDQRIAFALGDVAGKGMNAALLMAKTASLYRCLGKTILDPSEVLHRLNAEIVETSSRGMFVTMVAGIYDPSRGHVTLANAGHEPPILRTPDHRYETFTAACPPLGILPDLEVPSRTIDLDGGEFFIFSDGLTEFRYKQGEQLGAEGLIQMIEALASLPLPARMETLLGELTGEGWSLRDDLTVLAIDDAWVKTSKPHESDQHAHG